MFDDMHVTLIGGMGAMGRALVAGLLRGGELSADRITVTGRDAQRLSSGASALGVRVGSTNREAIASASVVFLCLAPHQLEEAALELRGHLRASTVLVSILAGVRMQSIQAAFDHRAVVRCMPNLPCEIAQGVLPWMADASIDAARLRSIDRLLGLPGTAVQVRDEHDLDLATPVSGAGPALTCLFMEALIDAAVHIGLPHRLAQQMVVRTVRGSAELLEISSGSPQALRARVTTPGGITADCIAELERGGIRSALDQAIAAGLRRTRRSSVNPAHGGPAE